MAWMGTDGGPVDPRARKAIRSGRISTAGMGNSEAICVRDGSANQVQANKQNETALFSSYFFSNKM